MILCYALTAFPDHYVFVNEYLWQVIEAKKPNATMISIIDLKGLRLQHIRNKEYISFAKAWVQTMDAHFPERGHLTMVVNSPKWFHILFKIISPLLRESTKAKVKVHSKGKKQDDALRKCIDNAEKLFPKSFFSGSKKKRGRKRKRREEPEDEEDEHEDDDTSGRDVPEQVSQLEEELREFVSLSGSIEGH